jgi:hypothetical protein
VAKNAREAGLNRLYHYEKFKPDYLTDVLINQRVHCSDPANLNDPWDCRPWFSVKVLDDPKKLEELMDWVLSFKPTSPVTEEQLRVFRTALRTDQNARQTFLDTFSQNFLKVIAGRWRIYCLTAVPDSTLMWSHYADNHRGVCLEFALDSPVFGSAREVLYLSSYPEWAPHSLMNDDDPHVLLTKADDWKYEREYRVVGLAEGISRPVEQHPLILSGKFLRLPPSALQAVIVGCEADYEEITRVVKGAAPALKVRRAVRARTKYRLEIME